MDDNELHRVVRENLLWFRNLTNNDRGDLVLAEEAILAAVASRIAAVRAEQPGQPFPERNMTGDPPNPPNLPDAAEMLWTVVANVSGGDWKQQSQEWQDAAARWRDYYFQAVDITPS